MNRMIEAYRRCERYYMRTRMEALGLLPLEGVVLHLLGEQEKSGQPYCKQEEICQALEIDKARVTRTLAVLEQRGLIGRTVNAENRREKQVSLTGEGMRLHQCIVRTFAAWEDICCADFSAQERAVYEGLARRMAGSAVAFKRKESGHG